LINEDLAKLKRREQDQELLRVFDGIPLGTDDAIDAVDDLSSDRFRAVLSVLGTVHVVPVGKGSHVFKDERVHVDWR
jgi:hypothetical protein